jgi:hypothetical protein
LKAGRYCARRGARGDGPACRKAARAALAEWDPADDPALECVSIGMPRAITRTGPHPIEFVERKCTAQH